MLPIAFSIHAATTVEDLDRERLRNLIAYVARPAVALNRLSWTESGDIKIALKTPWSDGTTAIILSPTELIEKFAALVPYPHYLKRDTMWSSLPRTPSFSVQAKLFLHIVSCPIATQ